MGPGLTVPDELSSQEKDSAYVIGYAVPVIPCGNQYAALCDMMPTDIEFLHGVQSVTIFDLLGFGQTLHSGVHQPD